MTTGIIVNKKVTLPFGHDPRSHMKHSFHVFHHGLKTFDVHLFLVFSCHDETMELAFHVLLVNAYIQKAVG